MASGRKCSIRIGKWLPGDLPGLTTTHHISHGKDHLDYQTMCVISLGKGYGVIVCDFPAKLVGIANRFPQDLWRAETLLEYQFWGRGIHLLIPGLIIEIEREWERRVK